jgi:hypothetical protein
MGEVRTKPEIGKGTCGALMSKVKKAEKEYEKAIKQIQQIEQEKERFDTADKRPRGRRPHFEKKIELAETQQQQAKESLDQARLNHETVHSAKAEIGKVYHPYNLESGQRQDSETVSSIAYKSHRKNVIERAQELRVNMLL